MFTRTCGRRGPVGGSLASRLGTRSRSARCRPRFHWFTEVNMAHFSPALAERVSTRHGVVTRSDLIVDGFSRREIDRLVERGTCIRIHNGVYRLATSPDTFESRCAAACAGDPEVVITGVAAARLWNFRHVWRIDQPVVLVAHDRTPLARGVVLRRSNVLDATDWVERRRRHPAGITASNVVRLCRRSRRRTVRTRDRMGARQARNRADTLDDRSSPAGPGTTGERPRTTRDGVT